MGRHSPLVWAIIAIWLLVTGVLFPVGLILLNDRSEPEWVQALGAGFLMTGTLSAGFFLVFISDQH